MSPILVSNIIIVLCLIIIPFTLPPIYKEISIILIGLYFLYNKENFSYIKNRSIITTPASIKLN
jgi:hypothetical protein